uniref:Uncharacterized protein n=1 Tax=Anguilla anguilla TaxID=7936 RepID=A0A0E9PRJ8_ANGAN
MLSIPVNSGTKAKSAKYNEKEPGAMFTISRDKPEASQAGRKETCKNCYWNGSGSNMNLVDTSVTMHVLFVCYTIDHD